MKKTRTIIITALLVALVACLAVALAGCKNKRSEPGSYGVGEEGTYYYDATTSSRYFLKLESGSYMLSMGDVTTESGTYSCDEETGKILFSGGDEDFAATMSGDIMSLSFTDSGYIFLKYEYYTVRYEDNYGNLLCESEVLNGKPAERPDGDSVAAVDMSSHYFIDWYKDAAHTEVYGFNTAITGNTAVYGWYVEIDAYAVNFRVTYDYGDRVSDPVETRNGTIYSLPSADGLLGWWVSATNEGDRLTYEFTPGEVLHEDTTLFAVYAADRPIGASVTSSGVTWKNVVGTNVSVSVYDETGEFVATSGNVAASGFGYVWDGFTALPTGTYEVVVQSGGAEETLTYVVNRLYRVSSFTVLSDSVLSFSPVENATSYTLYVTNGVSGRTVDLGGDTVYNFHNWDMTAEGITFVVTASADGFVSSVSSGYNFLLGLDTPKISFSDDAVSWDAVEGALSYEIYIDGDLYDTTEDAFYSLKYFGAGTLTVSVRAVAAGYYSEACAGLVCVKTSVAAPVITSISGNTVYWDPVEGASGYTVTIDGDVVANIRTPDTTHFAIDTASLDKTKESYSVAVRATSDTADDSAYCDGVVLVASSGTFDVTYSNGLVTWQYVMSASYYTVAVGGGEPVNVGGVNRAVPEFTSAGATEIVVTAYGSSGNVVGTGSCEVTLYQITLDTRGGTVETQIMYLAEGDVLNLPDAELEGYTFGAWYTLPDYKNLEPDGTMEYAGDGLRIDGGTTVFDGSGNLYLYAFYVPNAYTVTIHAGDGYFIDENGNEVEEEEITVYYNRLFTLPVAVSVDTGKDFYGWYDGRDASGNRYVDENGENLIAWDKLGGDDLYAAYLTIFTFKVTSYNGQQVASVSAGPDMDKLAEVTVPETCVINGMTYTVGYIGASAFTGMSRLEVINIPDTILYIQTVNNGYNSGSGAFATDSKLREVNVYATGDDENTTREIIYYSCDGVLFRKSGSGVTLVYYPKAKDGAYVVPDYVSNEYEYEYTDLGETVKVERPVETIATQVFTDQTRLTSVTIPATVTTIDIQAFYNASWLEEIIFVEGDGEPLYIYANAFRGCSRLESVTLPSRLASFDSSLFADCALLAEINVSGGGGRYTSVEGYLCDSSGTEIVYAPNAVTEFNLTTSSVSSIGNSAFVNCVAIENVTISRYIENIGKEAFKGCKTIKTLTFMGDENSKSLTIGEGAFYGCSGITSLTLPGNLKVLGADAFVGCSSIKTVTLDCVGDDLNFADGAFSEYVEKVIIGEKCGVLNISSVFGSSVTEVELAEGSLYYTADTYGVLYNKDMTVIAYYPYGLKEYATPDTLTVIGASIFSGRSDLEKITVSKCVTTIEKYAFADCTSLREVVFEGQKFGEEPVEGEASSLEINAYAFSGCTALVEISMPERLTVIGEGVFSGCTSLTSFTITQNVTQVGAYSGDMDIRGVFADCDLLTKIDIESGNKSFMSENHIIYDAGKTQIFYASADLDLEDGVLVVPETVTKIWAYSFEGNASMTAVEFGTRSASSLEIGEYAFADCVNLGSVTLPEGLASLKVGTFSGCTSLEKAVIPTTVSTMDVDVFAGDTKLAEIVFTERSGTTSYLTLADDDSTFHSVFYGLSALKSISLPEGTTAIPQYAFYGCSSLRDVYIPSTVTSIGFLAFTELGTSSSRLNVTFAEGSRLATLGDRAFMSSYLGDLDFSGTALHAVESNAFGGATLSSIKFPDSSIYLDDGVFLGAAISEVEIANAETVGSQAFKDSSVEKVTLKGVMYIGTDFLGTGSNVFSGCTKLKEVTIEAVDITSASGVTYPGVTLGVSFFYGCSSLAFVTLSGGIIGFGDSCFSGCSSLTAISIPATVTSIGSSCFSGCTKLTGVTFEKDENGYAELSEIEGGAFSGCTAMQSFSFPLTYMEIEVSGNIFNGCTSLSTLYISASVGSLEEMIVTRPTAITDITVEDENNYYSQSGDIPVLFNKEKTVICWAYMGETAYGKDIDFAEILSSSSDVCLVGIGQYSFSNFSWMTSINLPSTVTTIGNYAFSSCKALVSVGFEDGASLLEIGEHAFDSCAALYSMSFPGDDISIDSQAFYGCSSLSSADLSGVTFIGTYAFYQCTSLSSVTLGEGLECLGETATSAGCQFYGCTSLGSVTLPESLKVLGYGVFGNCTSLTEINLDHLTTIGGGGTGTDRGAFYNCGFTELTIPANITMWGAYAFAGCRSLVSVTFEDGCTGMGSGMFYNCTALSDVTLPNNSGFTEIASYAFRNCVSITSFDLTEYPYITKLGDYAFAGTGISSIKFTYIKTFGSGLVADCGSLNSVTFPGGLTDELASAESMFDGCSSLKSLSLPSTLTALPRYFLRGTGITTLTVPAGVTAIPDYMLYGCKSLTQVTFRADAVTIGSETFRNCSSLATVNGGITSIGAYAFENCSSLKTIDTSKVASLGGYNIFTGCTSLTEIDLSSLADLSFSQQYLFDGCTKLAKVVLSDTVTYLPNYMFRGCTSLKDVNMPASLVTVAGQYTFSGCGLESLTLPTGVTSLPSSAFMNCSNLQYVIIMGDVATVPGHVFENCTSLTSVELPLTATAIDTYAFRNCESLSEINLPVNLETIGSYAFSNCASLSSLIIPESTTTIAEYAFDGCTGLSTLWLGSGITAVGTCALRGCAGDVYIVNTQSRTESLWGSSWIASTGCAGTVHYYFDADSVVYTADGGAYAYNYWDVVDETLVDVTYSPDEYVADGVGLVLYNSDLDMIVGMSLLEDGEYTECVLVSVTKTDDVYTVVLDGGASYSVCLSDDFSATITAAA